MSTQDVTPVLTDHSVQIWASALVEVTDSCFGYGLDGARSSGRARQQTVNAHLFGKGLQQPALAQGNRQACAVEDPQGARHSQGMCTRGWVIAMA